MRGADVRGLESWLGDPRTELLHDVVDIIAHGRFEHRHLVWPDGEFAVRFSDITIDAEPRSRSR